MQPKANRIEYLSFDMLFRIVILLGCFAQSLACPLSCVCKWKGGKQTVECVNKSLTTIPQGMDPGTQVLDFAGNNLDRLLKDRFERIGLINLQKIYIPRCRLRHIESRAFKGLTNLVELDLSDNILTVVPTETFYDYPSLMKLFLNGNPIKVLRANSFQPLTFLTNLEMSHCGMEVIEDDAFSGLTSLEWLKLDNNKLNHIQGSRILPPSLHGVDLHHNPWQCDCKLLDVRSWLLDYNVPQTVEPTCSSPLRLKGSLIKSLTVDDLACLPDITPTTLYLEIAEGKNVSLLCRVTAIPEAKVSWWFQGNILQNDSMVAPGLHLYYYVEEGTIEKTSELFIFNTNVDDNGTFVCSAENQAGRMHSNYTIRIILKEEPIIGLAVFPYEYVVTVSAAGSIIALVLIISIVLCFVQCKRQKRRKRKKDRSKAIALQNQISEDKVQTQRETEQITRLGTATVQLPKINGNVLAEQAQEMMVFSTATGVHAVPSSLAYTTGPPSVTFQEQNPDLINDTGSKEWREQDETMVDGPKDSTWAPAMLPRPPREVFAKHLTADVHLSPGKFIGPDGYPIDYGLPKITTAHYPPVMIPPSAFYRTLPHKPRHTAANPVARFCREAEFLSYEQYGSPGDIRYTAEGYPCGAVPPLYPIDISPPALYKGTETPKDAAAQWPESTTDSVQTRTHSVGAQTSDVAAKPPKEVQDNRPPTLTESPDEGYEGDPTDM